MQSRMKNPATLLPDATQAIVALWGSVGKVVPAKILHLIHLRASQINGCAFCCDAAVKAGKRDGESEERLATVAAWRHAQYFSEAERAVLALTEALTRIADREDPVTDAIWDDAKRHFDDQALAAIVLAIATVNVWNRANVAIRQQPGAW